MNEAFRVGKGRASVLVSPWINSGGHLMWRFKSPATGRDVRRAKRNEARDLARDHLDALEGDEKEFLELKTKRRDLLLRVMRALPTEADLLEFLEFRDRQPGRKKLPALLSAYLAHKVAQHDGQKKQHLQSVEYDLTALTEEHREQTLNELTTEDLREWHNSRVGHAGPKRRNQARANLISLYKFAATMGEIKPEDVTTAQRLPVAKLPAKASIRYADRGEVLTLLRNVKPVHRLQLVLCLFAGLRPEEATPDRNRGRRGLCRSEIDLETRTIYIPAEVAGKVNRARRLEWGPNLEAWLDWAGWKQGQIFPISGKNMAQCEETKRLGAVLDEEFERAEGWPQDFLRHTYASHRLPILGSFAALAVEMGTSEAMIHSHYNQPLPKAAGVAFFEILPGDLVGETITEHDFKSGT